MSALVGSPMRGAMRRVYSRGRLVAADGVVVGSDGDDCATDSADEEPEGASLGGLRG
jgi:hypothetical protein